MRRSAVIQEPIIACCSVMYAAMAHSDLVISAPPKGKGASLLIRYDIPRPDVPMIRPEPDEAVNEEAKSSALDNRHARTSLDLPFQRVGTSSNTQVGIDFENAAARALEAADIMVEPNFSVPVGVGALRKAHRFDFGSKNPPTLVECKSHRWTAGGNAPSAKLTVWNEAMYYFAVAPSDFRKIFFVLRDFSASRGQTLAEHYLSRYSHLVPDAVEFWEYDEREQTVRVLPPLR